MKQLKVAHTMVSSPQVTARWSRKAPSRGKHYQRRFIFYTSETLKMTLTVAVIYMICFGCAR